MALATGALPDKILRYRMQALPEFGKVSLAVMRTSVIAVLIGLLVSACDTLHGVESAVGPTTQPCVFGGTQSGRL